jgi:putative hemolysin
MIFEILVILALIVLNGLLAMSELAIVSARPARLKAMADRRIPGARTALRLGEHPGRFLSAVQIGITLVGILAGAFSGATLGARVGTWLAGLGVPYAGTFGLVLVVLIITYLSLIIGELVPKQIALRAPERVAVTVAPLMLFISRLTAPLVWLLDASGKLILRLIGQHGATDNQVSDAEVRIIMDEAATAGVIDDDEREMIAGVMRVADRTARGLMTPRRDVDLIDLDDPYAHSMDMIKNTLRSRLPVCKGDVDNMQGTVTVRSVLARALDGGKVDLTDGLIEAPTVLDAMNALDVIEALRRSPSHMVLVYDEHGHFEGLITPMDVLGAITGDFDQDETDEPKLVKRADGTLLIAGWMPVDEFSAELGITLDDDRGYETVAGLVLDAFGHIPEVGERCEVQGVGIEVMDKDGQRVDKLLVTPRPDRDDDG